MALIPFNQPDYGFCRDCLSLQYKENRRCEKCGSPRLIHHPELYSLTLAHIDCDAFYASVEKRDYPELRNKPVIIGGGKRGVVSTACYIARISGVKSAMPMFKALELCPDAVVIPPDIAKYSRIGRQIRQLMLELTPLVEPLSIDEAFLDMRGTEKLHKAPAAYTLARFCQRIENEIGVTVSVWLSYCKFLTKIASDLNKPRGFSVIGQKEARSFLAKQPVTMIWGVGASSSQKLAHDGITTIDQLQNMDESLLMKRYGQMGQRLYRLSRGEDNRPVRADHEIKSISAETTFPSDLSKAEDLVPVLRMLSEKVAARLKASDIAGQTVMLKLKTNDFKSRTRNRSFSEPDQTADRIFRAGLGLLQKELDGTKFRLLGIGVQQLSKAPAAELSDLLDPNSHKRAIAENAMDKLREKFGTKSIETGYTFGKNRKLEKSSKDTEL
ncbi:DNA polymerase IV [uncultured Bartonella sp.]|uniref:DNA polymerase IV n=1 Tax=uncultured Bartonella sp. TaxID=104108 RepID=UPI00261585DA|nr:DNA polymerase IV [uncultured Bartonella sp.]